ncbi:MAG: esterase family protein [Christensenellaceae bacterium]|nr:esterase family protein [Christensenellaceae bacterium]
MALFRGDIFSKTMGLDTQVNVIFPDIPYDIESIYTEPKVLYLLHGLTDNASAWARLTQVEYFARLYNFIVVMPEVQRSMYWDMTYGPAYFTYVADELPSLAGSIFNLPQGKENTFIAGLSMGGYGSLKVAFSRPEKFAGAASFSGGVDVNGIIDTFCQPGNPHGSEKDLIAVFGPDYKEKELNDVFALGVKLAGDEDRPRLLQTCGTEDFLYEDNKRLKMALDGAGYGHTYLEWPGGHEWPFWNKSLELAMRFFRGQKVTAP